MILQPLRGSPLKVVVQYYEVKNKDNDSNT